MEVGERVCADQFVTFDSLVFSMLSEIGDKVLKLGWCHNVNPPPPPTLSAGGLSL